MSENWLGRGAWFVLIQRNQQIERVRYQCDVRAELFTPKKHRVGHVNEDGIFRGMGYFVYHWECNLELD